MESMSDARMSCTMLEGCASRSLNTLSITLSSVDVVSSPQNAAQSFTTSPAARRHKKQSATKICSQIQQSNGMVSAMD